MESTFACGYQYERLRFPPVSCELGHDNVGVLVLGYRRCFYHLDFEVSGDVFRLDPLA